MIHIIATGGTIEGLEYDKEDGKLPTNYASIDYLLARARASFKYTKEQLFRKDSRFITEKDRLLIAQKIKDSKENKILITHGTLTMVETAKYLGELGLKKTIVLVGSFILGTDKQTDASFNLRYAVSALLSLENGVYIAMHGKVFPWNDVVKNLETNRFKNIS